MILAPTPAQVARLVESVRAKVPGARRIGVRFTGTWPGPERLAVDGESFRVAACPSALAVREALGASEDGDEPLVVLTDRPAEELGLDVLARLAKRHIHAVDPWQSLLDLFGARDLDRRLQREKWLVDALLEESTRSGFPTASTGFLDFELAWEAFLVQRLGLDGPADARGLLQWFDSASAGVERFRGASDELRRGVRLRVEAESGDLAAAVLGAIESGSDPIAIGLVCRALFHANASAVSGLLEARVRLEPLVGGTPLSASLGGRWADEAEAIVLAGPAGRHVALEVAETLLAQLRATHGAFLSDLLPLGFEQRLSRFGDALKTVVSDRRASDLADLETFANLVAAHRLALPQRERAEAVEMALRLARWLAGPSREAGGAQPFHEAVRAYVEHGSFVDWARERLAVAEGRPEVADAYRLLAQRVTEAREKENRAFGTALAAWSLAPAGSATVIPVEEVLDKVLAPLAKAKPVLLVVLDGMSYAVFRELLQDLASHGWIEVAPAESQRRLTAVATVPTVTEFSRTSLLTGALRVGASHDERAGFASHRALVAASRAGRPPVLFHKSGLMGSGGIGVDDDLQEKVSRPEPRVVGVVLNAVDDSLSSGDQVHPRWRLDYLKGLRWLVEEADRAGRYVVLTADHGHVLERDLEYRPAGNGGERFRAAGGKLATGEIELSGPRLDPRYGASVVVPWSERIRYVSKRNGYHGGAAPQEVVVPLAVLTRREEIAGWEQPPVDTPAWWSPMDVATAATAIPRPRAATRAAPRFEPQGDLFATSPASWIDRLLASARYAEQRQLAERASLAEPQVRKLLEALAASSGRSTFEALEKRTGVAALRLKGLLVALRKLLNVDGYQVVTIDDVSRTVTLNRDLLEAQFELRSEA